MSVTIFYRETNSKETSLELNDDGSLSYHVSNSGWSLMRKGNQAQDTRYTVAESKAKWPSYADAIDAAVEKLRSGK